MQIGPLAGVNRVVARREQFLNPHPTRFRVKVHLARIDVTEVFADDAEAFRTHVGAYEFDVGVPHVGHGSEHLAAADELEFKIVTARSRLQQIMLANVLQNRLGQTLHKIMLHRVSGRRVERDE